MPPGTLNAGWTWQGSYRVGDTGAFSFANATYAASPNPVTTPGYIAFQFKRPDGSMFGTPTLYPGAQYTSASGVSGIPTSSGNPGGAALNWDVAGTWTVSIYSADASGTLGSLQGSTPFTVSPVATATYVVTTGVVGVGGTVAPTGNTTVNAGGSLTITGPAGSGYIFKQFDITANGTTTNSTTNPLTLSNINANTTVMAEFAQAFTAVNFSVSGTPTTFNGSAQGLTVTPDVASATYTLTYTLGGQTWGPYSLTGKVTQVGPTNAGDYSYTITATGTYTGSATGTFQIQPKPVTFTFGSLSQTYTGAKLSATVSVSDPAATYSSSLTSTAPDVGNYSVTATANGNYSGSGTATLAIVAKPVTFTFGNLSSQYTGTTFNATATPSDPAATYTSSLSYGAAVGNGYTVSASAYGNYSGSGSSTAAVTSGPPPVTASISANPTSATAPGSTTITWSSANATSVSVSGPNMTTSTATSGSANVTGLAAGTYTYTITAQGNGGPVSQSATVVVASAPSVTASISASPSSASSPASTSISWSSTNATSVSVSGPGMTTSTATSGSANVSGLAAGTYSYTITAQGNGGPVSQTATVTVNTAPNVTASISANPTSASAPGSSTISWSSSNATSVSVSGPNLTTSSATTGSANVTGLAAGSYTYTITAQGNGGPVTQTATVTVASGPIVSASISASPLIGTEPLSTLISWSSSNATSVSVSGPNLTTSSGTTGSTNVTGLAAGTYTYTLTAQGNGGPVTQTATVTVGAAASGVDANITANVTAATTPGAVTITWGTVQATYVQVTGAGMPDLGYNSPASGSSKFSGLAAGTYTYSVYAGTNAINGITKSVTFTISPVTQPPSGTVDGTISVQDLNNNSGMVRWSSTNATAVSVTGPGISTQTGLSGSTGTSILADGMYTYTLVAQGQGGPITRTASIAYVTIANRGISANITPSVTPWTGGPITLVGTTDTAGPMQAIVQYQPAGSGVWFDYTTASANVPSGTTNWFTVNLPVNPDTSGSTTQTRWRALITFTDSTGGTAGANSSQDAGPAPTPQTVTLTPTTASAERGATVSFTASGSNTGSRWSGTTASNGTSGQLTVPPSAAIGSTSTVSVYAPAAVSGSTAYSKSNVATATVTVSKSTPTLTWATPAAITYGAALSATQLNASANTVGSFVYSVVSGTIPGAGNQTLSTTFTPTDTASWNSATGSVVLAVNKATLTITPNDQTRIYGVANPALPVNYSGFVNGDSVTALTTAPTASTTATTASPVGSYPITASGGASTNYAFAYGSGTLTVTAAPVSFSISGGGTVTYDGTAKSIKVTPSDSNAPYSVTYAGTGSTSYGPMTTAPTNAGTYTVTIAATGNYCGNSSATLTIAKVAPTITWAAPAPITYGTALSAAQLDASANVPGTLTYNPVAGTVLGAGAQTLTAMFTPSDTVNYATATSSTSIAVNKAQLTVMANDQTRAYNSANPPLTVGYAGFVNGDTAAALTVAPTGATSATISSPVGSYPISPSGGSSANYSFSYVNGTLTITAEPVSFTIGGGAGSVTTVYDNTAKTVTVTPSDSNATYAVTYSGTGGTTYGPTQTSPTNAGTYTVTVIGTGNYSGSATSALTVNKATLTVIADDQARVFGAVNPTFTVRYAGFVTGDTVASLTTAPTASTSATSGSAVGAYPITPSGGAAANYAFSYVNGTLTITAEPVTFAVGGASGGGSNVTIAYDGTPKGVTVTPSDPNATYTTSYTGSGGTTYGPSTTPPTNTGTYTVTITGTGNYSGSTTVTLTITKATPTITWGTPAAITYGTVLGATQLNATASVPGTLTYTPAAGAMLGAGAQTLNVSFTPTDSANYAGASASVSLPIAKATLTVTANDQSRVYGASDPTFSVRYAGFVNGDTAASLPTRPIASTTATVGSPVGSYPITAAGGASSSYTFSYVNGTLTITAEPVTFTASGTVSGQSVTATYDGTPKAITVTPSDSNATYTVSYTGTGSTSYAPSAAPPTNAGAYAATIIGTGNYTGSASLTLTIAKATPTIAWAAPTAVAYGTALSSAQLNANADVAGTFVYSPAAGGILPTGAQTLSVGFSPTDAANFNSASASVSLTVNRALISVTANNASRVYGEANPSLIVSYSGFINGDTSAVLAGAPTVSTSAISSSDVGLYPVAVAAGTLAAANYQFTFSPGILTITAKPVTFTFANLASTFDGTVKSAAVTPNDPAATFTSDLIKGPDAGTYLVSATAVGNYSGTNSAELVISPATQVVSVTPADGSAFSGQPFTFAATGGAAGYRWAGTAGATGSGAEATVSLPSPGRYTVTVFSPASGNYLQSNTASATITVTSNRAVNSLTPLPSNYTVNDPASPLNGQTYRRLWQNGGWTAYLGRSGVQFNVKAQAWPSVKAVELQAKAPGADWVQLAVQNPSALSTATDTTFSVMLDQAAPGMPLVPLSFHLGAPLTGQWLFRARVQDGSDVWGDFSGEVAVEVVLPVVTKTVSGQTVPPAGALGDWFTASPVTNFSIPLWIP